MNLSASSVPQVLLAVCILCIGLAAALGYHHPNTAYLYGSESPTYTLLTTHFSHHSAQHMFSNLLALWMLLVLFPNKTSTLVCSFCVCIVSVSAFVKFNDIQAFLGLSALLYCIPGCYLIHSITNKKHITSAAITVILHVYLFMIVPMKTVENSLWTSMTSSHYMGFLSGVFSACFLSDCKFKTNFKGT